MNMLVIFLILPFIPLTYGLIKTAAQRRRAERQAELERRREEERRRAAVRRQEEARRQQAEKDARLAAEQAAREERRKAAQAQRDAETARRREERLEYARQLVELKERELQADKEWKALSAAPRREEKPAAAPQNNAAGPFAGETLSFTGKILNFNRQQVIDITERKGGKGRETIRTDCTILVVGNKPGKNQIEQAKKWRVKIVTWQEWYKTAYGFLPASLENADAA